MAWKDFVAQNMRGKKFATRMEANAFMKKLSVEWKAKKGKGASAEFAEDVPMKEGAGRRRRRPKPKVLEVMESESDMEVGGRVAPRVAHRKHHRGGSEPLLLSKGLGDGCHLSVLPK